MTRLTLLWLVPFVLIGSTSARAELVFFADGRSMSVKGHQTDGGSMVLMLRGGGQIVCDAALVARIEADEIPYPEPVEDIRVSPDPTSKSDPLSGGVDRFRFRADVELQTNPRFDPLIQTAAAKHGVDATLVRAVIQVESNYEPRARSAKGAQGLMQLMPDTARQYGVSNAYDPVTNLEAGIKHLKFLLDRFPLELALAAYNAGQATVERFGGFPPYSETRLYVDRILKLVGLRA
jgi:soluble lytic murein transglycosylase-like protein